MAEPLRALFYNEGAVGIGVLGHATLQRALQVGLGHRDDVEALMLGPAPEGVAARLAARSVPGFFTFSLDLQPTRWHLVQSLRARRAIGGLLQTRTVDVLHVHTQASALLLPQAALKIPVFVSIDASIEAYAQLGVWHRVRPWTDATLALSLVLERRAFERASSVVAWTNWAATAARKAAPNARVVTLHPGIDIDRFSPRARRPNPRTRILFVGARFAAKGGVDLVAALGPDLGRRFELDVVSQEAPPSVNGVRWHHLGPGDDGLVELHQRADIFCLPSYADAAPFAVVEALACGTPVIASDVAGIPDLLGDAGIVVARGDRVGLRKALVTLADQPEMRTVLGSKARDHAEARFDGRRQTSRLLELMQASRT